MRFLGLAITYFARFRYHRLPGAALCVSAPLVSFAVLCGSPAPLCAQMERPADDLMEKEVNTKIITVADMINRSLWSLAQEVFNHDEVVRLGSAPPDTKKRGVEVLLFTPGVGATVRIHW